MTTLQQIIADAEFTEHDVECAARRLQQGTETLEDRVLLRFVAAAQKVKFETISLRKNYEFHSQRK